MSKLHLHLELRDDQATMLLGLLMERVADTDDLARQRLAPVAADWVNPWQVILNKLVEAIQAARAQERFNG